MSFLFAWQINSFKLEQALLLIYATSQQRQSLHLHLWVAFVIRKKIMPPPERLKSSNENMEGCQGRKLAIVAGGVGCHKTRRLWSSCHPLCTTLPCNEFFLHRRIFCILHPKKKRKWDCRIFRPFALAWRHNKLLTIWDELRAKLEVIKRHEKRRRWWSSIRSLQQGGHQRGGGGHQVSHRWPSKGWTPDRGTHQADGTA